MYAREKVAQDRDGRSKLVSFFQYLTQATAKVDRCCLVASLLATNPRKSDTLGREIQAELYDIFQRQREEAVEPVAKEDVAEVLRRRFFAPESLMDRETFRQHVVAAVKGIQGVDEQTAKSGTEAEERFLKSFPFHPDLTEVLYSKWTQLARFQRTRGLLRTFALALREAEKWDVSPLVGPAVFLSAPDQAGLSEAMREMVAVAAKNIPDDIVRARLLDDISKVKSLAATASAAEVRVHTLPARPKDIEDDGAFHYAVLGPSAASESGKPCPEATRFLDETTAPDKPRVYRNAVLLLVPSKDGLELAMARVRDFLAWEVVREDVKKQQKDGNVDPARGQTLQINIDKAKGLIPEAIKQAYCVVAAVSENDEVQAFKITVAEDPRFNVIKADERSRVWDTAITAEALLPDGPYNLWRSGETAYPTGCRAKEVGDEEVASPFSTLFLPSTFRAALSSGAEGGELSI